MSAIFGALSKLNHLEPVYDLLPGGLQTTIENHFHDGLERTALFLYGMEKRTARTGSFDTSLYESKSTGPNVVLLHGFSDSRQTWLQACRYLSRDYHLIIPDVPGFGDTGQVAEHLKNYTWEFYSRWLEELKQDCLVDSFHLVGNSLGGAIGMHYASQFPIQSLTLVNSAGSRGYSSEGLNQDIQEGKNLFHVQQQQDFQHLLDRIFHERPLLPFWMARKMYRDYSHKAAYYEQFMEMLMGDRLPVDESERPEELAVLKQMKKQPGLPMSQGPRATEEELALLKVPVHVMWGARDSLFPLQYGKWLADHIPNAKLSVLKETGHCPQLENPKETARLLSDFWIS